MRNKTLILLSLAVALGVSFASNPPIARGQTAPTIIYQTGFETTPAAPDNYGDDTYWDGELWANNCGPDGDACIYVEPNYIAPPDEVDAILDYQEIAPTTESEVGTTWSACVINHVTFDLYYKSTGNGTDVSSFTFIADSDGTISLPTPVTGADYTFSQTWQLDELPGSAQETWFTVDLDLTNTDVMDAWSFRVAAVQDNPVDPPVYDLSVKIDNLTVWCDYAPDDLVRPFAIANEHPTLEMFDKTYAEGLDPSYNRYSIVDYPVYAFSDGYGLFVHAAAAGTVTEMRPIDPATDCGLSVMNIVHFVSTLFFGSTEQQCYISIPEEITGEGSTEIPFDGEQAYRLDLTDSWRVTVDIGSTTLVYFVESAQNWIEVGSEVNAGCVLGLSIQLLRVSPGEVSSVNANVSAGVGGIDVGVGGTYTFQSNLTNIGFTALIQYQDVVSPPQVPLYASLTRYPTNDTPCGNDPRFANCLETDPQLRQADKWTVNGTVTFDAPGFTLVSTNSKISETMVLDDATAYGLSVDVLIVDSNPRVELQLGETKEQHNLTQPIGEIVTLTIASDLHTADLSEYWTVAVRNLSNVSVKVVSICVSEGDVAGQPSACYFVNPSFDNGYANWDISAGVGQRDGSITVPDGDTFGQTATLPADTVDTEFLLYVDAYVWTEPGVTVGRTDYTSTVEFEYQFPDSGATWEPLITPNSTSSITFSEFALAAERQGVTVGTLTFQAVITIDADTTGDILIRPTITTAVSGILGVGIDRACLRGDFGVDQIDDIYGVTCQAVTRPQDENLSSWTVWLWRQFDRFFQCDLMIVLRQIRNTTTEIYRLTGWNIRYWKAAYFSYANWMSRELFPWLSGNFNNLASNRGIFYINNESGTNFWDFLIGLLRYVLEPLINAASALLGLVFNGIFGVIGIFLSQIFALISQIIGVISAILTGWQSASPTPIPGFPACNVDPTGNLMCIPLYILENTIFEPGTPGEILLTILISWGSLELLIWVIATIRQGIMEAAQVA